MQVHIPSGVGSFQGDFDFTQSKGFILRVSAGIDLNTDTITWLLQAIDPHTGEVIRTRPRVCCRPTTPAAPARASSPTPSSPWPGWPPAPRSAPRRACCSTPPPRRTRPPITYTIDGTAPTTTLTATPITAGSSDYQVQWNAEDDPAGSGVKSVTVYVSEDGGDYQIWLNQTTATSGIYNGQAGHTYQFLALAIDNAGNQEQPPVGHRRSPADDAQVNLGGLPTVPGTTHRPGHARRSPATQPSTNPLFTQAQQGIPSPPHRPASRRSSRAVLAAVHRRRPSPPASARASPASARWPCSSCPTARSWSAAARRATSSSCSAATGGQAGTPLATLAEPIYDMALDAAGNIWATTGGGPLLELDPHDRRRSSASSATA